MKKDAYTFNELMNILNKSDFNNEGTFESLLSDEKIINFFDEKIGNNKTITADQIKEISTNNKFCELFEIYLSTRDDVKYADFEHDLVVSDTLKMYLNDIGNMPLLNSDEEKELSNIFFKHSNRVSNILSNLNQDDCISELEKYYINKYKDYPMGVVIKAVDLVLDYLKKDKIDKYESINELVFKSINILMDDVYKNGYNDGNECIKLYNNDKNNVGVKKYLNGLSDKGLSERAAFDELFNHNVRLVISIAKKYYYPNYSLEDRIQDGNFGLIKAVEKFDPNMNIRFSTYATWWIRQSITREASNKARMIRLPVHALVLNNKIKKIVSIISDYEHEEAISILSYLLNKDKNVISEILKNNNGNFPSDEEISKLLDISIDRANELVNSNDSNTSLDSYVNNEEQDSSIGDFIPDKINIENEVIKGLESDEIFKVIEDNENFVLTAREKLVVLFRFGLYHEHFEKINEYENELKNDNYNVYDKYIKSKNYHINYFNKSILSLEEVAVLFSLTRERIRQIESKALKKIGRNLVKRQYIGVDDLKDYMNYYQYAAMIKSRSEGKLEYYKTLRKSKN